MPITATRFTQFRPLGGDQDGDGFADAGDILRHTLTLNNTGTVATSVVVNDLLGGSIENGNLNISPIAFGDSYTAVGNTLMEVGNATSQTAPQSNVAGNILSNDVDFFGDTFTISAFDATSLNGGTVNVITTGVDAGSFTYVSAANFTGSDTFTYTIRDDGLDGIAGNADDLVSIGTVTITVSNQVWYVDSSAGPGGNGTSTNPFDSLADVTGATGPDTDGDTIYVNTGTGDYTGGITLLNNQILHGEGTALVVGGFNLAAAGTDPTIANAAGNGVTLASGNTLTGFTVGNTTGFDIANTTTATVGNLTISNVVLAGTGGLFRADSGGALNVTFDSAGTTSATGDGIHLAGATTGSFTVTTGAISGVAGTDVLINGGSATIAIGSSITSSTGGSIDIGSHATNNVTLSGAINITGGTGISVHNNTSGIIAFTNASKVVSTIGNNAVDLDTNTGATINFTGGGLDIDTTTGIGFQATGGGTFSVTGSGNSVTTTTGTALDLNGVTVGVNGVTFATATTNGAANGILISSVGQAAGSTGIDVLGGAIVNASSRGVDILSTSADVAIASTISTTAAGRSVEVTNSGSTAAGGNTIVFSGAIDENGLGINLDNNDQNTNGATINFTGGLDIDSTTNTGFNAINGGTINVTGTNTVNNTSGIGVNVASTTIGASGLTFQTIATSGATSGIILNTTGAGAFTVTGTGTAGSGGTINASTGAGISLTSTGPVTLGRMIIQNGAADGVFAQTVAGFRLDNSSVLTNGNVVGERGVELNDVTGTVTFLNTTMSGNAEDSLYVRNTSGTMNLTVTGSTFSNNSGTIGNDGIILIAAGTSTIVASITGSTFTNNRGDHFQATNEADANSNLHATFSGNTLTNTVGTHLGGGITINSGALTGTSNITFNIANNSIQGAFSSGITINKVGDTGTLQGTIEGNTIGNAAITDSGSFSADGINVANNDNGTITIRIHNNNIFEYSNLAGINIINRDGSGRLNATVTNNTINNPGTFGTHGVLVQSGSAAGDAGDLYLDMENNTLAGSGANGGADFRIRQRIDGDIFLEGYGGGQYDTAAVVTYLQARNTGVETGTATVQNVSPDPNGFFNTATVPQPNSPTLPPAPLFVDPVPLPDAGTPGGDGGDSATPGSDDPAPGATDPGSPPPAPAQPTVVDDGVISAAELALIVEAAIQRWADAGATDEQIAAMRAVTFSVENMSGLQIGSNEGGHIILDDNAAGFNWFIDATPGDDSEYSGSGTQLHAIPGTVAAMRVDLLTTVMHELGHQIGLTDTYDSGDHDELMFGLVSMGERRLPGNDDLSGATGSPVAGIAFALTPINIGTIPVGQIVVVMWDSVVGGYTNQIVPTFTNFATITGNNPGVFSVNSNSETMGPGGANNIILDSLTLGNLVFLDANNNGLFDGADTGVNGVTLTLFADTNANGVFDGGDVQLATTTTAGGGLYSFANLSPGDYIVRVDAANFNVGGALVSRVTATGGTDPDNNTDDDDNGIDGAGGIVVSQAITLSHDNEPIPGAGNDTNNTLDFGFIQLNQAPTNIVPGTQTINEDATLTFSGGTAISVNDPDVGAGNLTVTLSVVNGQLTLSGTAGLSFGAGDGTDDTTMTFTGTQAAVNAALNGLLYETTLDYNGSDTLTINTSDNGNTGADPGLTGGANDEQDTDTVTINITAVNDTPVVTLAASGSSTEQVAGTVDATATISDIDLDALNGGNGNYAGATLNIANNGGNDANDLFAIGTSGAFTVNGSNLESGALVFATFSGGNGTPLVITFTSSGTAATTALVNAVVQSVQYTYTGDNPPVAGIDVAISLNDGAPANAGQGSIAGNPAVGTDIIHLSITNTPENSAPVVDLNGTDPGIDFASAYTEDGTAAVIADTDVAITDPDVGDDITGATITITDAIAGDQLTVLGALPGSIIATGGGTATITLSGTGTQAEYQQALTQILYSSTSNDPTVGGTDLTRTVTVTVTDGDDPSGAATTIVTVTGTNDAPAGTDNTITVDEDGSIALNAANFDFTDPDSGDVMSAVIITSVTGGKLFFDADGAGGADPVEVTAFPTAEYSVADMAAGKLTFEPNANLNGSGAGSIGFQVVDNSGAVNDTDPSANTLTVNVTPINDQPNIPNSPTVTTDEQVAVTLNAAITVSDVDLDARNGGNGDYSGAAFAINRSVSNAEDVFSFDTVGAQFTVNGSNLESGGNVIATLAQSGGILNVNFVNNGTVPTTALVNDVLQHLQYTNTSNEPPASVTLLYIIDDGAPGGGQGALGAPFNNIDGGQVTVNINSINDAPSGADKLITIDEDANQPLTTADFGFSDTDNDAFESAVVVTVTGGTLLVDDGNIVTPPVSLTSGTISAADIAAGYVSFQPTAHLNGSGAGAISFQVVDNGGTDNGGQNTDQSANTITFDIDSVNDAPAGADNIVTGSEDDPYVFTAADFGFTDTADSNAFLAVRIMTFPANGTLFLDSDGPGGNAPVDLSTVGPGVYVSITDINAGELYFLPDPDEFGAGYANFTFAVQDDGGITNGGQDTDQTPNTMTIDIAPDNLPPAVDLDGVAVGVNYTASYTEDAPGVAIGSGVTVTDPNSGTGDMIESATITLTDRVAGDTLTLTGALPAGIIAVTTPSAGAITIQITGAGTGAQYQALIESILYATTSQDPTVGGTDTARTITVTVNDGLVDSAVATTTVNITALDDAAVAEPDAYTITEQGTIVGGNLFADNGSGADSDPDGPPLAVSAVNGSSGDVGSQITLPSGALLTLNADGTFDYDPNGAFDETPVPSTGASNTPDSDTFSYTLAGGSTATVTVTITGIDTDDLIQGTAGADALTADGGTDTLEGFGGDDLYVVQDSGDLVLEAVGGGIDIIYSAVSYALNDAQEVENLSTITWENTDPLNLTGNALANSLIGNAGANQLDGAGGADIMEGKGGNDIYIVDNVLDRAIELAGGGYDVIYSAVSYTLADAPQVEGLSTLLWEGSDAIDLTGNSLDNYMIGNAGANTLDGGGGVDLLHGLGGNDIYIVNSASDQAIEAAGEGIDIVYSSVSYALNDVSEVENLSTITWEAVTAINLTGNALGNTLIGNAGANILDGKGGNDVLIGKGGADSFAFTTTLGAGNVDTIFDFLGIGTDGDDVILLDDAVFTGLALGALDPNAFAVGTSAQDASDRIIYDAATGALYFDADGNGAGAQVQFATLTGSPALTAGDFLVI